MSLSYQLDWKSLKKDPQMKEKVEKIVRNYIEKNYKSHLDKFNLDSINVHGQYSCKINISGKREWFKPTFAATIDLKNIDIN